MRIDKFLKVSRILKRRTVASEACDSGRVEINGKVVKPSFEVKVGDDVIITFATGKVHFTIAKILEFTKKKEYEEMFVIVED